MQLRLYLRMLHRGWWIIALSALAALNVALILSYLDTPVYRTSTRFIVSPNIVLTEERDVIDSLEALDKRSIISTYAEILNSPRIYRGVGSALQLPADDLRDYSFSTVVLPDANILELSVEGPNPEIAAQLANSVGKYSINYIKGLYQVYNIDFLDPAAVPSKPVSPQPVRDAGLAVAIGLALGAVLAILREQLLAPLEVFQQITAIDSVSSVYTRRYFRRRLEKEINQNHAQDLSLGLIQLDGLRDLVETLPAPVLQWLLRQVTKTLQYELRGSDLVGRWDDTCFAVLLPQTPHTAAARTLQRVQEALSTPLEMEHDGETIELQPRIGLATRRDNESAASLIEYAEAALERGYQKDTGPNFTKPLNQTT